MTMPFQSDQDDYAWESAWKLYQGKLYDKIQRGSYLAYENSHVF